MIALAVTTASSIASAQRGREYPVTVEGLDPEGCLEEHALRARVRRWLRRSGAGDPSPDLQVTVRAGDDPVAFTVYRDGEQVAERRFSVLPEACKDRRNAVAVAIALALEHLAEGGTPGTIPEPAGTDEPGDSGEKAGAETPAEGVPGTDERVPGTADDPRAKQDADAPSAVPRESQVRVHAAMALLAEVLPAPILAAGAGAELRHRDLRFALTVLATPEQEAPIGQGQALTRLVGARAHACVLGSTWVLGAEGCAGLAGGAALANGRNFMPNHNVTMVWLAPLLRAGVRYPRRGLISVTLALEGMINAVRPRLTLIGSEEMQTAGSIGGSAGLELSVGIP